MPNHVFVSNLEYCRLEAEISNDDGDIIAIIYEGNNGWCVDNADGFPKRLSSQFIEQVKSEMSRYVNRKGIGAPHECTKGELALWLMLKDDGTAMGVPFI